MGRVAANVLKKLPAVHERHSAFEEVYVFVGYGFSNFALNDRFDIAIGEVGGKWDSNCQIRLKKIYDEFGSTHNAIPDGYKTICLLECKPQVPAIIKKLPALKTWDFGRPGVNLYNHSDLNLLQLPDTEFAIFESFRHNILATLKSENRSFSYRELEQILPPVATKAVIDNLLTSGLIRKHDDVFEVVG